MPKRATTGKFPSLKMERMISYASTIELDCIIMMEFGSGVITYTEQPFTISYKLKGRPRRYTPDFYMEEGGSKIVIECKPHARLNEPKNQLKFRVGKEWCTRRGMAFRVVTDSQLRTGYRLHNIKLLSDYARYIIDESVIAQIMGIMVAQPLMKIADLLTALDTANPQSNISPILYLLYHKRLFTSLDDALITTDSVIGLKPVQPDLSRNILSLTHGSHLSDTKLIQPNPNTSQRLVSGRSVR